MKKLVECIPNFSEGRDPRVIEALADAAQSVPGAALLDYSADADHNRSVFTLLGDPDGVAEAAFRMCAAARDMIDMTKHTGEHPCVGATDVIPFVPVGRSIHGERGAFIERGVRRIRDEREESGSARAICEEREERSATDERVALGERRVFGERGAFIEHGTTDEGAALDECVALSRRAAARISGELGIPCFLYGASATREHTKSLSSIRKGGFGGMSAKLLEEGWAPDFGARAVHPSAGVTVVGARRPLVAFNINLTTPDIRVAKKIAKKIRASGGGFECCKAIGVMLHGRNIAQVSMNMEDCGVTPLYAVYEAVKAEAERCGAGVLCSEIIGLAPAQALADCAKHYMKIENFDSARQVLESRIIEME